MAERARPDWEPLAAELAARSLAADDSTVQNNGIALLGGSVVYDVHDLDGGPNPT